MRSLDCVTTDLVSQLRIRPGHLWGNDGGKCLFFVIWDINHKHVYSDEDKDSAAMFNVASTSEILVAQKKKNSALSWTNNIR